MPPSAGGRNRRMILREADGIPNPVVFVEDFAGQPERPDAGRDATIDGDLQQRVLEFVQGAAVAQRGAEMQLEFIGPVERRQHA